MNTRYNYVFFNINEDYLEPGYFPLRKYPFVRAYKHAFEASKVCQKLFFYHWSGRANKIIKLPFKKMWFRKMFCQNFVDNKPICYFFRGGKYIVEAPQIYSYIKKLNPHNQCVVYWSDLISKSDVDIEKVKKNSDYILCYDKGEAENYGIVHFDDICYGATSEVTEPKKFINDVYFLGFSKDRIQKIHDTYKCLTENGLKCKFIICGAREEDKIHGEGLIYSKPISYGENIENVKNSKCILEIIQGGSESPTLRTTEAQIYKRKLLTNNVKIKSHYIYDEKNISTFEEAKDINVDFLKDDIDYNSFHSEHFNPINRIIFLENLLGGGNV